MKKLLIASAAVVLGGGALCFLLVEGEPRTAKEQAARAERALARFLAMGDLPPGQLKEEQDRVLAAFRKTAEKFPDDPLGPKGHRQAAELLVKWKRPGEALEAFKAFVDRWPADPDAPDMLWAAAELALQQGGAEETMRLWRVFADKFPRDARAAKALLEIAQIMKSLDRFAPDDIRAIHQEILDKHPESDLRDQALLGIAEFYKAAKAYDEALRRYDRVIEEFEGRESAAKALLEKGKLLAETMDKKQEAARTFEELEKKHPGSEPARRGAAAREEVEKDLKEEKAARREEEFQKEHFGLPAGDLFKAFGPPSDFLSEVIGQKLDLEKIDLAAEIDPDRKILKASAEFLIMNRGEDRDMITLQLSSSYRIESVEVSGKAVTWAQPKTEPFPFLRIRLPGIWPKGTELEMKIAWTGGEMEESVPLRLGRAGYAAPGAFWHPFTVYGDLFTGKLSLSVPPGLEARATGSPAGTKKDAAAWTHAFEAKQPVFGFFFAYGEFRTSTEGAVTVSTVTHGFPNAKEHAATADEILKAYASLLGPLPWERLDVVEADLPAHIGGISPPNLILLNSRLMNGPKVPESLLAHELAHQWWGNLVPVAVQREDYTPWLSEGMACYLDAVWLERKHGAKRMEQHLAKAGLVYLERVIDLPDVAVSKCWWVHPQYFAVTYMKGSVALHLLRRRMGDAPFFDMLRLYAREARFRPAGLKAFRGLCEKAHGKPLAEFFSRWIEQEGFPHLKIEKVEGDGPVKVTVRQLSGAFPFDLPVAFEGEGKREERIFPVAQETETLEANPGFKVLRIVLDPAGLVPKRPGPHNEWKRVTKE